MRTADRDAMPPPNGTLPSRDRLNPTLPLPHASLSCHAAPHRNVARISRSTLRRGRTQPGTAMPTGYEGSPDATPPRLRETVTHAGMPYHAAAWGGSEIPNLTATQHRAGYETSPPPNPGRRRDDSRYLTPTEPGPCFAGLRYAEDGGGRRDSLVLVLLFLRLGLLGLLGWLLVLLALLPAGLYLLDPQGLER